MEPHKNKGRYLISSAILQSTKTSFQLKQVALECVLSYCGDPIKTV